MTTTLESSKRATEKWRRANPQKFKECAKRATYRWREKNIAVFRAKNAEYMRKYRERKKRDEERALGRLL